MKDITKALIVISFFISLFSIAVSAQTKTNPKVASKPVNEKPVVKPSAKSTVKSNIKSAVKPTAKSAVEPNTKAKVKSTATPAVKPKPIGAQTTKPTIDKGEVVGNTYTNNSFNFEITLPENWVIPGDDFEEIARKQGFNLNIEAPKAVNQKIQSNLNQTTSRVSVILNAFRYAAGDGENAILRVSIEDLRALPQVKDAVDYFDLMRETFKNIKLPADFKYSETQAERLGKMQFGFLDTSNDAGKKRMYATVRNGYAVMFTLSYKSDEDLAAIKNVLAEGNFRLK